MKNGENLNGGNDMGGDGGQRREEGGLPDGGSQGGANGERPTCVLKYHGAGVGVRDADGTTRLKWGARPGLSTRLGAGGWRSWFYTRGPISSEQGLRKLRKERPNLSDKRILLDS